MSNQQQSDTQYGFFALNKGKILAAIVLIVVAIGYFTIDIRYKEVEINTGFNTEARHNPYLAAQMFINRMAGLEDDATEQLETYRTLSMLNDLPSPQDTIIIATRRHTLTPQQIEDLQTWVKQGGHLVLRATKYVNSQTNKSGDKLLDDAGISVYEYDKDDTSAPTPLGVTKVDNQTTQDDSQAQDDSQNDEKTGKSEAEEEQSDLIDEFTPSSIADEIAQMNENQLTCDDAANLSSFPTEPTTEDALANIESPDFLISDNNDGLDFWSSDGYGPQIMQIIQGKGRLTVLTDIDLWRNRYIHCFDNAYFLQFVINHQRPNPGKTWIIFNEEMPGVLSLLWQYHRPLIISGSLLLLGWLLMQSLRLGPITSQTQTPRRSFLEHLEAATRYRWHSGVHQDIVEQLRQQIISKMAQRQPLFEQKPPEQQAQIVARIYPQNSQADKPDNSEQVYQALFAPISSNPQHNVQLVRVLQQIRKHL